MELHLTFENVPWWKWLSLSSGALRALGADPTRRLLHVGHRQPLPRHWVCSVGLWGGRVTAAEVRDAVGAVTGTYDQFRARWGLFTAPGPSWEVMPFDIATRVGREYEVAAQYGASRGAAAYSRWKTNTELAKRSRGGTRDRSRGCEWVGILPVEYVLYREVLNHVLEFHQMSLDEFHGLDLDELEAEARRRLLWLEADPPTVRLPQELLARYAHA